MNISTVIPAHFSNTFSTRFLVECLDSLEAQTFAPHEVIISDDSKGVQLDDFISSLINNYSFPIRVVRNAHQGGIGQNTNFGLKFAQGDIVHVLHQDDLVEDKHLYADVNLFFQDPATLWLLAGNSTHRLERKSKISPSAFLGFNDIGGPSVCFFRNHLGIRFDEEYSMLVDVVFFEYLRRTYGEPVFLPGYRVSLRTGEHQHQHLITQEEFEKEQMKAIRAFKITNATLLDIRRNAIYPRLYRMTLNQLRISGDISSVRFRIEILRSNILNIAMPIYSISPTGLQKIFSKLYGASVGKG